MFLVNSCLDLFSAPRLDIEDPFSRSYGVSLPSSLTVIHSSALVYSTRLRVSVCGTGAADYTRYWVVQKDAPYSQGRLSSRICLGKSTPTPFNRLFRQAAALPLLRLHVAPGGSTGILTGSAIGIAIRLSLRTRLTLIRLALIRILRRAGFTPALSLLIPTFAFPHAPAPLAGNLRRRVECSPTNI